MGHIKGFGVKNFRVFKDQTVLNFAPLTVFTGSNNSGKSSIINALIFLKENFSENSFFDLLENNNVSNFGQFDSILHSTKTSKFSVYFSIPWNTELVKGGSDWLFELTFSKDRKRKENIGKLKNIRLFENTTKTVLIDLTIIGQEIVTRESFNYFAYVPVYTFIQALNVSHILKRIEDVSFDSKPHVNQVDIDEMKLLRDTTLEKHPPKPNKGVFMSSKDRTRLFEVEPTKTIPPELENNFSKILTQLANSNIRLKLSYDLKSSEFRFFKFLPQNKLLLSYIFQNKDKKIVKKLENLEKQAVSAISNGKCLFENDTSFLQQLLSFDVPEFFSLNNKPGEKEIVARTYATYGGISGNLIPNSLFIFELLIYEVFYLILLNGLHDKVMIDFKRYRELEIENADGAENEFMCNKKEGREKYLADSNLSYIEDFFQNLTGEIIKYLKSVFQVTFISSIRGTYHRTYKKEGDNLEFSKILNDFINKKLITNVEQSFINYWIKEFEIGESIEIENIEGSVNILYIIKQYSGKIFKRV